MIGFMPDKYKFNVDFENEVISINGIDVRPYTFINTRNTVKERTKFFIDTLGISVNLIPIKNPKTGEVINLTKESNKALTNELGCSPKQYFERFRKICYKTAIGQYDIDKYKSLYLGYKGQICLDQLLKVKKHKQLLDQAMEDNQKNILPLLLIIGESPKECKKFVGKGAWKSLCANSYSRNLLLWKTLYPIFINYKKVASYMTVNPPYSILKCIPDSIYDENLDIFKQKIRILKEQKCLTKKTQSNIINHLIKDTKRLCNLLNVNYNHEWSLNRIKEEHDRMSKEYSQRKDSLALDPTPFKTLEKLPLVVEDEKNGIKSHLMNSNKMFTEEGIKMKHCVAIYRDSAKENNASGVPIYLLFSIRDNDETPLSTLMLRLEMCHKGVVEYKVLQHYGPCNSAINETLKRFEMTIKNVYTNHIQQQMKEKQ